MRTKCHMETVDVDSKTKAEIERCIEADGCPVYNVEPGHARMYHGKAGDNHIFIYAVSDEHSEPDVNYEKLEAETIMPLFGIKIHSAGHALVLADVFAAVAKEIMEEGAGK